VRALVAIDRMAENDMAGAPQAQWSPGASRAVRICMALGP